jgi:hypothetical protein
MFTHGCGADSKDRADLGICFCSGEPAEHLSLTQSQQALTVIMSADQRLSCQKTFSHMLNPSLCNTASDSQSS